MSWRIVAAWRSAVIGFAALVMVAVVWGIIQALRVIAVVGLGVLFLILLLTFEWPMAWGLFRRETIASRTEAFTDPL